MLLDAVQQLHASVGRAMQDAWNGANAETAKKQSQRLAASRWAKHAGAAASKREGLEETLTVQALGITGALYRTLRTTNPIENLDGPNFVSTDRTAILEELSEAIQGWADADSQGKGTPPSGDT